MTTLNSFDTAIGSFVTRWQAKQYARALPTDEVWPPFRIVVEVENSRRDYGLEPQSVINQKKNAGAKKKRY